MFLGIDGGGTKTALCLVDATGRVRGVTSVASSYYFGADAGDGAGSGPDRVAAVMRSGLDEVCAQAGISAGAVDHAFIGLPGYGESSADVPVLDALPATVLGHQRYAVDNDMVCGWAGGLGGADGINVISGTGSMTYGRRNGVGLRVGGWGELFGDEGSAYWIAVRGLGLFSRMSDGRLPAGPLADVLREHLQLLADLDLVHLVLDRWGGSRSDIAALAVQVDQAARRGDEHAAAILADAGRELAELVGATRRQLGFAAGEPVDVSWSGGTFGADAVLAAFTDALASQPGDYRLREPLFPPVVGAAVHAAQLAGTPLEQTALDRLRLIPTPANP